MPPWNFNVASVNVGGMRIFLHHLLTLLLLAIPLTTVSAAQSLVAERIGMAHHDPQHPLTGLPHLMAHAATGAIEGKNLGAKILGTNPTAGAVGAVVAEAVGGVLLEKGVDRDLILPLSQAMAVVVAGALDLDPNEASRAGGIAVEENVLAVLVAGAFVAYEVYEAYDVYEKEGFDGLLKHVGVEVVTLAAGGVVLKTAGKAFTFASKSGAFTWAMHNVPGLKSLVATLEFTLQKVIAWDQAADARLGAWTQKIVGTSTRKGPGTAVGAEVSTTVKALDVAGAGGNLKIIRDANGFIKGVEETQCHHIISNKHELTRNHKLWELAGMSSDDRLNKMLLPTLRGAELSTTERSIHWGRHFNKINEELAGKMQDILELGQASNWSQAQYAQGLKNLLKTQRALLKEGKISLNKHART